MSKLDTRIDELQRDLEILSTIEDTARKRLAGEDAEWERTKERSLEKMFGLIVAFKIEDVPSKAVAILGQLMADAERLRSPKRVVAELDNKRKMLHTLRDQARRRENSSQRAQEAYDQHMDENPRRPNWLATS